MEFAALVRALSSPARSAATRRRSWPAANASLRMSLPMASALLVLSLLLIASTAALLQTSSSVSVAPSALAFSADDAGSALTTAWVAQTQARTIATSASRATSTIRQQPTLSSAFLASTVAPLASQATSHHASPASRGITWPTALAKNARAIARAAWRKSSALSAYLATSNITLPATKRRSRRAWHTKWSTAKSAAFPVRKDTKPQTTWELVLW